MQRECVGNTLINYCCFQITFILFDQPVRAHVRS